MAKLMYCVACEEIVLVEEPISGHSMRIEYSDGQGVWDLEFEWCEGPFEECEPETDPDWEVGLVEPSEEELFMMNTAASELLSDLGI